MSMYVLGGRDNRGVDRVLSRPVAAQAGCSGYGTCCLVFEAAGGFCHQIVADLDWRSRTGVPHAEKVAASALTHPPDRVGLMVHSEPLAAADANYPSLNGENEL